MMRMVLVSVGLLLASCAARGPCGADAGTDARPDDAGASDVTAPTDAPTTTETDAGVHCASPSTVVLGPIVQLMTPSTGRAYEATDTRPLHIQIYRHGETTPAFDARGTGALAFLGPIIAGDYDLAVALEGYQVGGALMSPETCGATDHAPYCLPLRLRVTHCEQIQVPVALYCNPASASCATTSWPGS